jgi:hypothetical protein
MRWLLVMPETVSLPALERKFRLSGNSFNVVGNPIPIGDGEISIEVVGGSEVELKSVVGKEFDVRGIFPASDLTLY